MTGITHAISKSARYSRPRSPLAHCALHHRAAVQFALTMAWLFFATATAANAADRTQGEPQTAGSEAATRSDLQISGVCPHLTTYAVYSQNGAHNKPGHDECGIGAVVPWAGRLWMVNYAPHQPRGSEHKLFSVDADLQMTVHPESVGGTPAGRMIHRESNQLLIAHYVISSDGQVRVIPIEQMPIRVTAIARHLTDPVNKVYYVDMEGSLWEANVHTLEVTRLFKKPVPGWHAKGGYTSQGRLVMSNNGEHAAGTYDDLLVGGPAQTAEERGVLAEFDGKAWSIIERRQYTEVTGPQGIHGGSDVDDPIWAVGWDRRSLRLKLLEDGQWHTYLLPKAALCNDAIHGWYTEWPRIREITGGRWMMDMHGMFFDFSPSFSATQSAGLRPIGSHLRYIPDFCAWNDRLVLASDETSIQGNPLAGQPQSNLWFGTYEDLKTWGPASGYGGPWVEDHVTANSPSDPFLVAGFDRRTLHLAVARNTKRDLSSAMRATDQQTISQLPEELANLPRVTIMRGDWKKPAPGYHFTVDQPVTVYLAVDQRGEPQLEPQWKRTQWSITWGKADHTDAIYKRSFPAGMIEVPANPTEHIAGSFGMPHMAIVQSGSLDPALRITPSPAATVTRPEPIKLEPSRHSAPVQFQIQLDIDGNGNWTDYDRIQVPVDGYVCHLLPADFDATWLRLTVDRDCVATAFLHQTSSRFADPSAGQELFHGLADVNDTKTLSALVYPAKQNRNLVVTNGDQQRLEFTKAGFEFKAVDSDPQLAERLEIEPEFTTDDASVILTHRNQRLRLPRGDSAFDKPFAFGWPRGSREVESERHLANIHGTFYEVPLITNGQPPAFDLMRPVASHAKQIRDFCSWNGLLVLTGVSGAAKPDGHVFADPSQPAALWFGGVDDLWKLGKPIGRGGPWKATAVLAGQPSDAYLMTGYDKKTLTLQADTATTITIEVDVDHQSGWHSFKKIDLKAGEPRTYEFPEAFSAHWVRLIASSNCTATGQFRYE